MDFHTLPNDEFARIDDDVVIFDWTEILRRAATDEPFAGAAKVILAAFKAGWEIADPFDWRPEQVERMREISTTRDWRPNRIVRTASDTGGSQVRAETGFE